MDVKVKPAALAPRKQSDLSDEEISIALQAVAHSADAVEIARHVSLSVERVRAALEKPAVRAAIERFSQTTRINRGMIADTLKKIMMDPTARPTDRISAAREARALLADEDGLTTVEVTIPVQIKQVVVNMDMGELFDAIRTFNPSAPISDTAIEKIAKRPAFFSSGRNLELPRANENGAPIVVDVTPHRGGNTSGV